MLAALALTNRTTASKDKRPVRVAVIGGMMKTGLWPAIAQRFEADTGCKLTLRCLATVRCWRRPSAKA
jgi:hypothetical protein